MCKANNLLRSKIHYVNMAIVNSFIHCFCRCVLKFDTILAQNILIYETKCKIPDCSTHKRLRGNNPFHAIHGVPYLRRSLIAPKVGIRTIRQLPSPLLMPHLSSNLE